MTAACLLLRFRRLLLPDFRLDVGHSRAKFQQQRITTNSINAIQSGPSTGSTLQSSAFKMSFKAVIFDIGGVVVGSPLFAINK